VICQENNLTVYPNSLEWNVIYMVNNSNIVFLGKNNNKWIEKLSDIPQKWFLKTIKKPNFFNRSKKFYIA